MAVPSVPGEQGASSPAHSPVLQPLPTVASRLGARHAGGAILLFVVCLASALPCRAPRALCQDGAHIPTAGSAPRAHTASLSKERPRSEEQGMLTPSPSAPAGHTSRTVPASLRAAQVVPVRTLGRVTLSQMCLSKNISLLCFLTICPGS